MSFNPYQAKSSKTLEQLMSKGPAMDPQAAQHANNDTKMSNNEAFMAFLQKNGDEEDEY